MRRLVCATVVMALMSARLYAADEYHLGYDQPMHDQARGGFPNVISRLAIPSQTPAYSGYYVGGGRLFFGSGNGPAEGTWGWDYSGRCLYNPRLMLGFGTRRSQGGYGSYSPDRGPHVPNPLGWKIPSREHGEGEGGEGEGH